MNKREIPRSRSYKTSRSRPYLNSRSKYTNYSKRSVSPDKQKPNVSKIEHKEPDQSLVNPVKTDISPQDKTDEVHVIDVRVVKPLVSKPKKQKEKSVSKRANKKPAKKINHDKKQPIELHIDELRKRALGCVMALVLGGAVGYHFQTEIIAWLVKPLGQQLFYTSPTGGFDFLIKICLFFGFLLAVPVIIYNFIRFLAPAVPERVSYSTVKLLFVSVILALLGVAFAYYVSLPAALHFLNNFTNDQIQSLISAQEYFNFVMIYLAGFAILFQMPLIFAFINKVTPLRPYVLMKKQRLVILGSFIIAAFLTPTPDPMNQTIMAIPIIGLYQTSIGVVWQDNKRKSRKAAKQAKKMRKAELVVA